MLVGGDGQGGRVATPVTFHSQTGGRLIVI